MPRGIPNSGHRKAKGPRKFGPDKKPGPKPKSKPPEEQKILKGYRATRCIHELLEQLRQIANNATPAQHTHIASCLRAMREAQGAEAGAGKDQEPE